MDMWDFFIGESLRVKQKRGAVSRRRRVCEKCWEGREGVEEGGVGSWRIRGWMCRGASGEGRSKMEEVAWTLMDG
jgi:hypothetical protein